MNVLTLASLSTYWKSSVREICTQSKSSFLNVHEHSAEFLQQDESQKSKLRDLRTLFKYERENVYSQWRCP